MTVLLADFESANLQALKNAGYSGICRYLSFPPNGKNITQTEWAEALALGLTVNLNWEEGPQDMAKGSPVGVTQGHEANVLASALNPPLPMTRPIIYSADWDCQPAQYNAVEAYLRAAATQGRPAGVYGKNALVDEMMRRGAATVGWVSSAWLYGQPISPRAALFQRLKPTLASGQNIDEDVVVNGTVDYGQYPLPTGGFMSDLSATQQQQIATAILANVTTATSGVAWSVNDIENTKIPAIAAALAALSAVVTHLVAVPPGTVVISDAQVSAIAAQVVALISADLKAATPPNL